MKVVIGLVAVLTGAVLAAHLLFRLAGSPEGWPASILYVLGLISTAGYFPAAVAKSWLLVLFSLFLMVVQWTFLLVLVPLFLREWLGEYFEARLPTELPRGMVGHVLVCGYNAQVETLLQELQEAGETHVCLVNRRETVEDLNRRGTVCLRGDAGEAEDLRRAGVETCRVLVAAASDQENMRICLAAERLKADVRVIALAELTESARVLTKAGAEAVVAPKLALACALAAWVVSAGTLRLEVAAQFPEAGYLVHLRLNEGFRLLEQPLTFLRELPGTALGVWTPGGEFLAIAEAGTVRLTAGMVVAAVARPEECLGFANRGTPGVPGAVVVAGMGDVGREVVRLLAAQGVETIELHYSAEMDRGHSRRTEALLEAGLHRAEGYVLAMDNDDNAIYSALLAREMTHAQGRILPIVARANQRKTVEVLQAAGVDEVFCLGDVADTLLSGLVLGRYRSPLPQGFYRLRRGREAGQGAGRVLATVHDAVCVVSGQGTLGQGEDCLITLELAGPGILAKEG